MSDLPKDLIAASSFPIILMLLSRKESYGYEIIKDIAASSQGKMEYAEGTLYPILKKMESAGWISSRWEMADNGRERKYYRITAQGKKQLKTEKENWQSVNQILESLWLSNFSLIPQ